MGIGLEHAQAVLALLLLGTASVALSRGRFAVAAVASGLLLTLVAARVWTGEAGGPCLVLGMAAAGVLVEARAPASGLVPFLVGGCAVVVGLIAASAYLAGIPAAPGWPAESGWRALVALAAMAAGLSLQLTVLARAPGAVRWLPGASGALMLAAVTLVAHALGEELSRREARAVAELTEAELHALTTYFELSVDAMERMANRGAVDEGMERRQWNADAQAYLHELPGALAIGWFGARLGARLGQAGDEEILQSALQTLGRDVAPDANARHLRVLPGPRPLLAFVRSFPGDTLVGLFDTRVMVERFHARRGGGWRVVLADGERTVVVEAGHDSSAAAGAIAESFRGLEIELTLRGVAPATGLAQPLALLTFVGGLVVSCLFAGPLRFALVAHQGRLSADTANRALLELQRSLEEKVEARTEALRREVAAREEQARVLQRSNAELERFAYVASHDLQEPLRTITSFTQLIDQRLGPELDPKSRRYFGFVVDASTRMSRLISDLLQYARVGSTALAVGPVDLDEVMGEVQDDLRGILGAASARLEVGALGVVSADRALIQQCMQNLVQNAVKFRREEPPVVRVWAEQVEDELVAIHVADNGIGIEPRFQDRIFELFRRLHTRSEYEGTGIGLTIVQRVAERHGGQATLRSVPGEGSEFVVTLAGRLQPPGAITPAAA
ncbi:MAG: hypothetical protein KC613_22725 [Myxococcales bacterium]|nr:hypothetical protein [Myxococcales bacterium]